MQIFKEDKTLTDDARKIIRKILLGVCWILLAFSIPMALMSPFAADAPYNTNIIVLIMLSLVLMPIMTIVSMILSKKSLWWFLLPLIPIAIYMLSSIIGDNLRTNSQIQSQPQPLSTRGLPVPVTDVPVILPPDPGEAGKATLAGIDSNNDGVRDDLEREIVYMYPQNEEVRRVLRAMVKKGQDVITTTGDHEHFKALMISYFSFQNCYTDLVIKLKLFGDNSNNISNIYNMIKNTPERSNVFYKNDKKAGPYSSDINYGSEACAQV